MDPLARYERDDGPTATILTIGGELDVAEAEALRAALGGAVESAVDRRLVVDLTDVAFLDSSAIGQILWVMGRCREMNTALQVVAPEGSRAALVFELAGIGSVIPVADGTEAAIAALVDRDGSPAND